MTPDRLPMVAPPGTGQEDYAAIPEQIPVGTPLDVIVATTRAHPSNQLVLERHAPGRALSPLRAWPQRIDPTTGVQYFRTILPALEPGEVVEYRPVLSRAGQVLETMTPKMVRAAPKRSAAPLEAPVPPAEVIPRYAFDMEFLGALTVQLRKPPESFGPVSDGLHVTFYIASGEVSGPKINAKILGEGGDWMLIRRDGVGVCNVPFRTKKILAPVASATRPRHSSISASW